MGNVVTFPIWDRRDPITVQPWEINCQVVYNFLDWEIPKGQQLSVFDCKWLDRIVGYRNRESYNYLKDTRNFYDARTAIEIYGTAALPENVRDGPWPVSPKAT